MCFSATGSFGAAALLTGIGIVTCARNNSKPHRMFAVIPLIFGAQQAVEGMVWLTMQSPELRGLQQASANTFLGTALILWPLWMPAALWRAERDLATRRILAGFLLTGVAVATYAAMMLWEWHPIPVTVGHSIRYAFSMGPDSFSPGTYLVAYALPTVVPFFMSTSRLARPIGAALIVSLILATIVERDALTSVWCFFAAVLSGLVLWAVQLERRFAARAEVNR